MESERVPARLPAVRSTATLLAYLRIVVSALGGITCLLLVVLWVRSYSGEDVIRLSIPGIPRIRINSVPSRVYVTLSSEPRGVGGFWTTHRWNGDGSAAVTLTQRVSTRHENLLGFGVRQRSGRNVLHVPHWFLVITAAAIAAAPWIRSRLHFSLRTLLLAVTLLAVLLGLVALSRKLPH